MNNRKNFLISSGLVVALMAMLSLSCTTKQQTEAKAGDLASSTEEIQKNDSGVGVQLFSVRQDLKKDFEGTIKKLAEIGYQYVEGYGLNNEGKILGKSPEEFRKIIEDSGMELISMHSGYFTPKEAPKVIEAAKAAGVKYLIIPHLPKKLRNDYHAIAKNLNEVGKLFKDTGIEFGYHNHAFEFDKQGEEIPMETLLKETDPELVTFEMDLYWVTKAGHDPMELINKFPGRFSLYHVKDADKDLNQTTLGTGIIDFKALLDAKEKAGLEYYFVEDERTDNPLKNMKANFEYISQLK